MKILAFEHNNFGIEDMKEVMPKLGNTIHVVSTNLIYERVSREFDELFEAELARDDYDLVFTFNYSAAVSNNCNRHNVKYVAWVYDSPLVSLYSYTITNPCNYIFLFDSAQYLELKNGGIDTVYYMPLAVNTERLNRMECNAQVHNVFDSDIAFVGSMYNEKGNFYERLVNISAYTKGYLDAIMQAQLKIYGASIIEELLTPNILEELEKDIPYTPNRDGIETPAYIYANYFLARKMAQLERQDLLSAVSEEFSNKYVIKLYTHNPTPQLPKIKNMGAIDYYDNMPYVFKCSRINLNISLRSIKNGIPLRCMDILGAGGFLLSNFQADFLEHFIPDEDFVYFDSKQDLINKCRYYLEHENERLRIQRNGCEKVREFHNYKVRWDEMMKIVIG
jgi:spore maturation protein CgeB